MGNELKRILSLNKGDRISILGISLDGMPHIDDSVLVLCDTPYRYDDVVEFTFLYEEGDGFDTPIIETIGIDYLSNVTILGYD
jgi:hypothetical protein